MSEDIKVSFSVIQQLATDVQNESNKIQSSLDTLDSEVKKLYGSWDGQAQQAYLQAKAKWSEGMNDMRQVLVAIGSHVSDASGSYRATDSSAAQAFGG